MAEIVDKKDLPPEVAKAFEQPAQTSNAGVALDENASDVNVYDVPQDVAAKLLTPTQLEDYRQQKQYGEGVGNVVRAGIESGVNQALLGAGDALMVAAGADAEALRQRRERNEVASAVGGAGGFILPLVLTGGESAIARAGVEAAAEGGARIAGARLGEKVLGEAATSAAEQATAQASTTGLRNAIRFTPTPAGAAKLGEAVQGFTERALADSPVAAKLAGVVARNATEGAIYGTGSAISDVVRDGDDVLGDHETAAEYLMYHAVEGAGIGGLLGGAIEGTLAGASKLARKAGEGYAAARDFVNKEAPGVVEAPGSLGKAAEAQGKAAEASEAARRAQQEADRLNNLPDYVAPKSEDEAKRLLEKIVTQQTGDAAASRRAVEDVTSRLSRIQTASDTASRVVDDATVDVADKLSQRERLMDELMNKFTIGRKFRVVDEAIMNSADVAPVEVVAREGGDYVGRLKNELQSFENDPDGKIASLSKRLLRFTDEADFQIKKAVVEAKEGGGNRTGQLEVFKALDNLKRAVGFARTRMAANAGDMELRNLPGIMQGRYIELANMLEDAGLYGEKAGAIQKENNSYWTKFLDVAGGFEREFMRTGEYGAGKTASGFGSLAQGDSAKVGSLLGDLLDPKKGLQLQVFTQGLDTGTGLIEQLAKSLKATPEEAALVKEMKRLTNEIGDHLKDVAQTHADAAEYRALSRPIAERQAAIDAATKAQGKAQELGEVARTKAEEASADLLTAKADARTAAQEEKAAVIRKAATPAATAMATGAALAAGLPWWVAGGAVPLSAVVGQVMSNVSAEKLIQATSAGFRATDRAATAIADAMTSKAGRAITSVAKEGPRGAVAVAAEKLGKGDTKQKQYERIKAELDTLQQDANYFAASSPLSGSLVKTPMLMATMTSKRANAIRFLKSKLPAEFKPLMPAPQLDKSPGVDGIQVRRFLRYASAVNNPQSVLEAAARGDVTPEGFEALREVYPAIHKQLVTTVFDKLATADRQPSMQQAQHLSLITGVPMHFTMTPEFIAGYQSIYANAPTEAPEPDQQAPAPNQRARNVTPKTPDMYATSTQGVENGLGRG